MTTQLFHTSSTDTTWLFIGSSTWTAVEVNIGIVSGEFSRPFPSHTETSHNSFHPHDFSEAFISFSNGFAACLPSLRPILVAIVGDSRFRTGGKGCGSRKITQVRYHNRRLHDPWSKSHQETYIRASNGSESRSRSGSGNGNIWDGSGERGINMVHVRHDAEVMGERRDG